jgi:hypothetical protein
MSAPPPAEWPSGSDLATALSTLDVGKVDDEELIEAILAWERLVSWAQAGALGAVAEFARRRPPSPAERDSDPTASVSRFAADELAAALPSSRTAAQSRVKLAQALADRLPTTATALAAGRLDLARARVIADGVSLLTPEDARAVEARVLDRARWQTPGQLRATTARAVLATDPAGAAERRAALRSERRVVLTPRPDGEMAELWALLPAEQAMTVRTALDALADTARAPDDVRTVDQRRADVLVDVFADVLEAGGWRDQPLARQHRRRPHLQVTVGIGTLLGVEAEPGELAGYGPISAELAREIAADATWSRLLLDAPSGTVLDVGRTSYEPPAGLASHVLARDRTCRFPGCRQPASRVQLDHTVPFPDGPTSHDNLGGLCQHHHRLKHEGGWQLRQDRPGTFTWTSPTGRDYTTGPDAA